jgi:NNP family nitrate/nitrite transporter-like MFS transporter
MVGFMAWVILAGLMPFIKEDIHLEITQISWLTAIPVILGSILRIPFGYLTNKFGARLVFIFGFLLLTIPVYLISIAESFSDLLIGGIFVGFGGAVFSIGVTSLPKYFPKEKQGFVNGIYGVGNIGTAITTFFAPVLASQLGWRLTVQILIGLICLFILLHFFFGDKKEEKTSTSLFLQVKEVYSDQKLWFISIFYFITFGSFVAFTVYLPNFLVTNFGIDKVDAGLRTAGFIALATFLRPIGGKLADKINSYKILVFVFLGLCLAGILLAFNPNITLYTIGCLSISFFAGVGNGTIFKLVPLYFSKQAGFVNGFVAAIGGLGGFFPPLILTTVHEITGHYAIGFMALSEVALASLVMVLWLYKQKN